MNGDNVLGWFDEPLRALGWSGGGEPMSVALLAAYSVAIALLVAVIARTARTALRSRRQHRDPRVGSATRTLTRLARPDQAAAAGGPRGWSGERLLIGVAIVIAIGVAGIGGMRSFNAVSQRFDSMLVPLLADGMIVACTALRLAALSRGWRLPGCLVTTYVFIAGTVWLNVASARDWADVVAHALAPLAYAALVELLAHMLRLHLGLVEPTRRRGLGAGGVAGLRRLGWLTWATSPMVTTRVGLHLARTGGDDPIAARALVQQLIRMSSRLRTICPSRPGLGWWPFDGARSARTAALQTIRDGLLSSSELAALLPTTGSQADRLTPGALLALVDAAALRTTPVPTARTVDRTGESSRTQTVTAQSSPVGPDTERNSEATIAQPSPASNPTMPMTGRQSAPRTQAQRSRTPAARPDESDELLMRRTRHLDEQYRSEYGKPMTRDALRAELKVSNARAGALLRAARKEEVA
jgi:hypothetical protein